MIMSKPTLHLTDDQISEFIGDKFDSLDVDSTGEFTVKFRVSSKSKSDACDVPMCVGEDKEDEKEDKPKTTKRIELELTGTSKNEKPLNFKRPNGRF